MKGITFGKIVTFESTAVVSLNTPRIQRIINNKTSEFYDEGNIAMQRLLL